MRALRLLKIRTFVAALIAVAFVAPTATASTSGTTANRPQVLIAVTNSESMDGNTAGAIMLGSGTADTSLAGSSSPPTYLIPTGFQPPLGAGTAPAGSAPYVLANAAFGNATSDNGPSRLNMAKQAIGNMIGQYAGTLDFALEDFSVSGIAAYTTWVYYMSPNNQGFTFTNTPTSEVIGSGKPFTVANPCRGYTTAGVSSVLASNCTALDGYYTAKGQASIAAFSYMLVGDASDEPSINDVLYSSGNPEVYINDGGTYAANYGLFNYGTAIQPPTSTPYTVFALGDYNSGQIYVGYNAATPPAPMVTGPTNAGFVPYSPEVMYAQRGFGFGGSQSASSGNIAVSMQTAGSSPSATTISAMLSAFTGTALRPETSNAGTKEIKAAAGQAPVAGLLAKAKLYLASAKSGSCQQQYVVLITDGLPTEDLQGKLWPPLGSAAATGYGVTASFNTNGTLGTTNDQAATDTISAITALKTAGIKTYVVGLGAGVDPSVHPTAAPFLTAMAIAGGTTNYFPATSSTAINAALMSIADQIYRASAIAAPIPPVTIASGSLVYEVSTNPVPVAGHVQAYAVAASGQPGTSPSWDAGGLMTATTRQATLLSTDTSGDVVHLTSMDSAAFNLTATPCVPDVATVIAYTIDPSYAMTNTAGTNCTYLAGRQLGWFLGGFGLQNAARLLAPPSNPNYLSNASYLTFARSEQARTPSLLFNNEDGFLYAVNAQTGALEWGWMPRPFVAQLQNFASFQNLQLFNGDLTTVDAVNGAGSWATYVVGAAQGSTGAGSSVAYYALKLGTVTATAPTAMPISLAWWQGFANGQPPSERNGIHPVAQAPSVAILGGSAYAVYIVNTTSGSTVTSTLTEQNVATGTISSNALSFTASGEWFYDQNSSTLWVGDTSGNLWQVDISGTASADVGAINTIGPAYAASTQVSPITYVGYTMLAGIPYAWATNGSGITAFGIGANGWQPLWAATSTSGYLASVSTSGRITWSTTSAVPPLTTGASVSDAPGLGPGGVLGVPAYVPPASGSCNQGAGYDDFYNLATGAFPTGAITTIQQTPITQDIYVSAGIAFTPRFAISATGVPAFIGGQGTLSPPNPLLFAKSTVNLPVAWRQH